MNTEAVDSLIDLLAVLLTVLGVIYSVMPMMFRTAVGLTRGLLMGLVGALIAVPLLVVVAGSIIGVCAIVNLNNQCRSPQYVGSILVVFALAQLVFPMLVGFLVGTRSGRRGHRPAAAAWSNAAVIGVGLLLSGLTLVVTVWGTHDLSNRMLAVTVIYWFIAGSIVDVPVLTIREEWTVSVAIVATYVAVAVAVGTLSLSGPQFWQAGWIIEAAALFVAFGFVPFFYGFAFCNPPQKGVGTPSIERFLVSAVCGLVCGMALPLLSFVGPADPQRGVSAVAWPVAMAVTLLGGHGRLLLHEPQAQWLVRHGRHHLDVDVALQRFAHGLLVGFVVVLVGGLLYEYDGRVVGTYLNPAGQQMSPLFRLAVLLTTAPFGALPLGIAVGLLEVVGPWLSHRIRVSQFTFTLIGIIMTALGGLILIRPSLSRLLGL